MTETQQSPSRRKVRRGAMPLVAGILAAAMAGGFIMPGSAGASGWLTGERLPVLRGAPKEGAAGYETVRPNSDLPNPALPGVFGQRQAEEGNGAGTGGAVILAQSGDAALRMSQMEEQMRQLTGQVEELTFQLLQLQEQIRRMQEDNEFRFQELEEKQGNLSPGNGEGTRLGKLEPSDRQGETGGSDGAGARPALGDLIARENARGDAMDGVAEQGRPPINLGTLTFDENGNVVDSNVGAPIDLTGSLSGQKASVDASVAASADELFELGFQYVQGGRYEQAASVFERFSMEYPGHARHAEAQFWLGESLFSLGRYEESAQVFLENHRQYPDDSLAAENLLKLGVSLAGLNQRELACATYAEVGRKYPGLSNAVRMRVASEQAAARCIGG